MNWAKSSRVMFHHAWILDHGRTLLMPKMSTKFLSYLSLKKCSICYKINLLQIKSQEK
jgi:hypothetical protein